MNKIAIYTRKSKFTGKGESIENQIEKCKKFIEFKFNIDSKSVNIFIDEGFSGKNEDRPEYQRMMNQIKSKQINSIVIYQLNRLGRNARDIHNTMQLCDDLGTIIYSATEGFDSSTSFGRAVIGILASLAQLEREQLAERVKDNMYTLAKMGRWLGGQSPLGFDGTREYYIDENGKERSVTELKPNKEELNIVKLIYQKYIEEKSLSQVAKWSLTNHLKGKNGGNITKSAINVILKNPVYVKSTDKVLEYLEKENYEVCGSANGNGLLRYGKDNEQIIAVSKHKGIINADDWMKVQNILKENTDKAPRRGKTNTALLTGILKCNCGSSMNIAHGKLKNGTKTFYYQCAMKVASGGTRCKSKNLNGPLLEEKLIDYLKNYSEIQIIADLENILNKSNELNLKLTAESIDNAIEQCDKSIKVLVNKLKVIEDLEVSKIIIDELTKEKDKKKDLEKQKENLLEDEASKSLSEAEILEVLNLVEHFKNNIDSLDFESKKKLLNELIESIVIDTDEFIINFNIKKN